jgi:hypothetical protein
VRLVARPTSVASATGGNSNSLHPRSVLGCRIQRCGDDMIDCTRVPHTIGATPLGFAAAARTILRLLHAIYAYVLFRSLRKAELRTCRQNLDDPCCGWASRPIPPRSVGASPAFA